MTDVTTIRPLGNRILVKLEEPAKTTESGIILPGEHKAKRCKATIVALGQGIMQHNGWWLPWNYKPGDNVLLQQYAGIEVGEDHLIVSSDDILAVIV
jgi:chaperonin GroES